MEKRLFLGFNILSLFTMMRVENCTRNLQNRYNGPQTEFLNFDQQKAGLCCRYARDFKFCFYFQKFHSLAQSIALSPYKLCFASK